MRKLIFQEFISLDGYAADRDHSTKFFESDIYSKESDNDMLKEMNRFDTILLGATTYKMFAEFWPEATTDEQIVADKLNSIPKIVFSNTLKSAPWGKWPAASLVSGDAVTAIRDLKKKEGKDMVLWGSISLAQDLIKENLIDEYHFRIVPVILGGGTLLFTETDELKLKIVNSKAYTSGLLLAHYERG
jgi:dihydrofolate reductase